MNNPLNLRKAQQIVISPGFLTKTEVVPITEALDRIASAPIAALRSVPAFPRAAMDGFAVFADDTSVASPETPVKLEIAGEIAAGVVDLPEMRRGQALRIMTGAIIPPGANTIVPLEQCREHQQVVIVNRLSVPGKHIRKIGTEVRKGKILVKNGHPVGIEQLPLLAEAGIHSLSVFKKPRLAFLCTGTELLETSKIPRPGQIVSGNRFVMDGLTQKAGAEPIDLGLAADKVDEIASALSAAKAADVIVTTGGMGPGKFDLMKEVYKKLGINILYDSLNVRPGRATMFGLLDRTLYFALPGPPPAARLLFQELVRPALLALLGHHNPQPKPVKANLNETISLKKTGMENLKGGRFSYYRENLVVRPAHKNETINCIILIPKNRRNLLVGEKVAIHPID